jgi:multidrug resistance efflux pump
MKQLWVFILPLVLLAGCKGKEETPAQSNAKVSVEPERIVALGRVEPEVKVTPIGSEVNGVIRKIYVHAGDTVKKDQLLVEFEHNYEDAKLAQINAKVATQNAEIKNVQAQIATATVKANNLKTKYERLQKIFEQGAETKQNTDNAKADYDQAASDVDRLQAALNSAQSKLNEIAADARVAAVDVERRKVKAPANGVVLTMDLTEGSAATTEKSLMDFAPESPLSVLCEVDEMWVDKLVLGQKAFIRTQGTDDKLADGVVVYLSPYLKKKSLFSDDSANMEDRRVREVRIRLNNSAGLLINSRVEAVIELHGNQ